MQRVGRVDFDFDGAVEFFFKQTELFAALVDFAGFGTGVFEGADDFKPLALEAKNQARGFERATVQSVGGPEKGENFAERIAVVAIIKDCFRARRGELVAMVEREESQGAAIGIRQAQSAAAQNHARAHGGMFGFIDASAHIVNEGGGAEKFPGVFG